MDFRKKLIFGNVITPEKLIRNGWVSIDGGWIKSVSLEKPSVKNAPIVNCEGKFVCPGFVDVHVQGSMGFDVWQSDPACVCNVSKALARFGTTSFLATTHFEESVVEKIRRAKKSRAEGARILGIHLETPFVNVEKRGAIEKEDVHKPSLRYLKKVLSACGKDLKLMTIAPELPGALEIIRELRRKKVVVSIGHTDANYEEALRAIRAGAAHATHMFNAMSRFNHREPAAPGCLLTEDGVALQVIADGIHLHRATVKLIYRAKNLDDIVLITDAVAPAGLKKPRSLKVHNKTRIYLKKGAVRLKNGTLAGAALTMNRAVKNFIDFTGASVVEAVRCASLNPARSIGFDRELGAIERGKRADIAILDRRFNAIKTFIDGKLVYNR